MHMIRKFEDTKAIPRSGKSNDRQNTMAKSKRTKGQTVLHIKLKIQEHKRQKEIEDELMCSGRETVPLLAPIVLVLLQTR